MGRGGGEENLQGAEPRDGVLTTCKGINTHVSQRYFQAAEDLSVFFLMFLSKFSSSDEVYDVSIS